MRKYKTKTKLNRQKSLKCKIARKTENTPLVAGQDAENQRPVLQMSSSLPGYLHYRPLLRTPIMSSITALGSSITSYVVYIAESQNRQSILEKQSTLQMSAVIRIAPRAAPKRGNCIRESPNVYTRRRATRLVKSFF